MKVKEIEKLLSAFYDGKTTEYQEELLKEYFATNNVPEQFLTDKKLFLSFHEISKTEVSPVLESELIKMIDKLADDEKRFMVKNKSRLNWRWIGGIAASMVILFGVGYSIIGLQTKYGDPKDTFSDPKEAYIKLQEALIEVSSNLNGGMDKVAEFRKEVNEINNEIIGEIQ